MENKKQIEWAEIYARIEKLKLDKNLKIYGVPRGGQVIAGITGQAVDNVEEADLIIDDLIDSGKTMDQFNKMYDKPFIALFDKRFEYKKDWLVFPWELNEEPVEHNIVRLLQYLGEDPNREGLQDTPKRYVKFLREFLEPKEFNFTTFDAEGTDEMIIQKDIPFYSLCEHHMAPFFGVAHVAYIPNKQIVGLSKLARTVDLYANRLQNQERITTQIAERLMEELKPKGVAVSITAQHLCMCMRGVKKHDTWTTTSKMLGGFKTDSSCRAEFLNYIK